MTFSTKRIFSLSKDSFFPSIKNAPIISTNSTISFARFKTCFRQIIFRKKMSFRTVSFSKIFSRKTNTTTLINGGSDWLQMFRIYTFPIPTQMIQLHSFWYWSFNKFISNTVSRFISAVDSKTSIPSVRSRKESSFPYPACFRLLNFNPKSFFHIHNVVPYTIQEIYGR